MKTSGHTEPFIKQAVEQGIRAFDNKVKRSLLETDDPGYHPLFPKAGWRRNTKSKAKALKRATWFRGGRDETEQAWKPLPRSRPSGRIMKRGKIFRKAGKPGTITENNTVVFVPSTKGGTLIRSLKEDEDRMAEITGFRIKFQEAGGNILANAFNTNLGSGQPCGRKDCPPCEVSEGKVDCKARSIMYESVCLECNPVSSREEENDKNIQPAGRIGVYVGESSRSLHERATEHVRDARAFSEKSHTPPSPSLLSWSSPSPASSRTASLGRSARL